MSERMIELPRACAAWGTADFAAVLKAELEALPHAALPLQAGLARTGVVAEDEPFTVLVGTMEDERVAVTVLYSGLVLGCSCSDDPTPIPTAPEQCHLELVFEPEAGLARCRLTD